MAAPGSLSQGLRKELFIVFATKLFVELSSEDKSNNDVLSSIDFARRPKSSIFSMS